MHIQQLTSTVNHHQMARTERLQGDYERKMSSGLRINSAKDDVGNVGISSRMTAQINGYNQGRRNASDGLAMVTTFNEAMSQVTDILNRMYELSIQSANGVYSDQNRRHMNQEFQTISEEIDRIGEKTRFNGLANFDSGNQSVDIILSGNSRDVITFHFRQMDLATLFPNVVSIENTSDARSAMTDIKEALEYIVQYEAELAAYSSHLNTYLNQVLSTTRDLTDTRSRLQDANVAEVLSNVAKQEIIESASLTNLSKVIQTTKGITRLFA